MEKKMTVDEFLNEMSNYYEAYYEDQEGFDSIDDAAGLIDLALKFYEQRRGSRW